jgi:hypothetical protein
MQRIRTITLTACALGMALAASVEAQFRSAVPVRSSRPEPKIEIAAFGGYAFGGRLDARVDNTLGRLEIADQGSYGMTFSFRVRPGVVSEFLYVRQPTTLYFKPLNTGVRDELFPMHVAYYQLNGLYEFPKGALRPFAGVGLGLVHFNPKQALTSSEWRMAANFSVGFRAFVNERIGIRGQFHGLLPFQFSGGGIFCGGGGCSVGLSGGTAIIQGMVSGGLVVAL